MRGAASDFGAPRDMRIPEALRPYKQPQGVSAAVHVGERIGSKSRVHFSDRSDALVFKGRVVRYGTGGPRQRNPNPLFRTLRYHARMTKQIFTIGYEGADMDRFLTTLKDAGVATLADVRAVALSRKRGFSKSSLATRWRAVRSPMSISGPSGRPRRAVRLPGRAMAR